MSTAVADRVYEETIRALPAPEQLRLAERIVRYLSSGASQKPGIRKSWSEMRGIAPSLLGGEDAQQWVSRSRSESDSCREVTSRGTE